MPALRSVVVVGASLAGLRAAEELRHQGFEGPITMVGDEPHRPYDRPPLSKQVLAGSWEPERTVLPAARDDLDLTWRTGTAAVALDLAGRTVALADGTSFPFDGLVIATGATPNRLPFGHDLAGVHTLRTLDDCLSLRADLDAVPGRVVVVGAGFIGAEVAATCRERGLEMTLVEALPQPMAAVVGVGLGEVFAGIHRDEGVDVRTGVGVAGIEGSGRVERVRLADGAELDADVVVVGVGVKPATGWLEGSGLEIADGVVCDPTCLAAAGIVAAGDVARWVNPLFGESMRVEHWDNALDQGGHAARRLLDRGSGEPYAPVPWFWSDQYRHKIQVAGRTAGADQVAVVEGSIEERRFTALFGRGGRLVGVLGLNRPRAVVQHRAKIASGIGWEDACADATGRKGG